MESKPISKILKYTFLISGTAALIFGFTFLFLTEIYLNLIGWIFYDPMVSRVLGAALIGLWVLQWLSFRESEWQNVKNVVIMMIVWHLVGGLACLISQFIFNLPIANWLHIIVLFLFLFAYILSYYVEKK
ncbi:MAG: hypothetical protein ACQERB_12675 [Promethearchaeati archaeon]